MALLFVSRNLLFCICLINFKRVYNLSIWLADRATSASHQVTNICCFEMLYRDSNRDGVFFNISRGSFSLFESSM